MRLCLLQTWGGAGEVAGGTMSHPVIQDWLAKYKVRPQQTPTNNLSSVTVVTLSCSSNNLSSITLPCSRRLSILPYLYALCGGREMLLHITMLCR